MKLAVPAALFVLALGSVGCSGSQVSVEDPADEEAALQSSSHALSQDFLCAAVAAFNDNFDGSGLQGLDQNDLHGDALHDFKAWQHGMESDYPSQAFKLPVKFKNKTYTFIMVTEMNDGGGSGGLYKLNGSSVATQSGSESGPITWSSPADRCEQ